MLTNTRWYTIVGILGLLALVAGCWIGLFVAPAERHMGEVQRIMYVHVPSAKNAVLVLTVAFLFAIGSLATGSPKWDALMTGATETGVVLTGMLLAQGMIWGKPTWGVWWDWDVRLTTSLIMLLLFAGILALRAFIQDPERRATWSAVAVIVAYVDVPLVYFCVRWFRSLHQIQSSPETVSATMVLPLRLTLTGFLLISVWLIVQRARLELGRRQSEWVEPPERLRMRTEEARA